MFTLHTLSWLASGQRESTEIAISCLLPQEKSRLPGITLPSTPPTGSWRYTFLALISDAIMEKIEKNYNPQTRNASRNSASSRFFEHFFVFLHFFPCHFY